MNRLPPLNALKAFEASGRHLNFRLAAEEIGVTHGAVAQHVRALEARMGVKLFERLPRGLALTDEGGPGMPSGIAPTLRPAGDLRLRLAQVPAGAPGSQTGGAPTQQPPCIACSGTQTSSVETT